MKVCTKCKIEKELDQYYKYFHSSQQKWRVRGECTDCYYKTRLKRKNPELYYENNPDYKKCKTCSTWKLVEEFHFHSRVTGARFTECKLCQNEKDKIKYQQELEDNGGSSKIPNTPNKYKDKWQKEQTFMVMGVLGYIYDESAGIWTKPGVKELVDGKLVFPNIQKKKRYGTYDSRVTYDTVMDIVDLREKGLSYDKIGDKLGMASTTAFKHYTRWQNKLK